MIGAGQLARMTCQAAPSLGISFRVLAGAADESAAGCDVVTFDHEHVPGASLQALEQAGVPVRPGSAALRHAQDKQALRDRLARLGVACPRFAPVASLAEVIRF